METRREIFAAMGAAFAALGAAPAAAKVNAAVLERQNLQRIDAPFGEARIYFKGETAQLQLLEVLGVQLNPGTSPHPPHEHPEEEILLIAQGSGEFSLDGNAIPCAAGAMLYAEPGHLHGITNTGSEPLQLYVFKWQTK